MQFKKNLTIEVQEKNGSDFNKHINTLTLKCIRIKECVIED